MQAAGWDRVLRLAQRQHGIVFRSQILDVSDQELRTLTARRQFERVERGVYRVGGYPPNWEASVLADCRSSAGRAFGLTGATAFGLGVARELSPGRREVVVPSHHRPTRREGLVVRRSREWDNVPSMTVRGLPVLPLRHTLVSIAMHHPYESFRQVLNEARRRKLIGTADVVSAAEPFLLPGVRHRRILRTALDQILTQPTLTLSEWSDQFVDWCVIQGLPRPHVEYRIFNTDGTLLAQVDICWPEARVVVELDSWAWHSDPASFEKDRQRYSALSAQGWTVIAVTWKRWKTAPDHLAQQIREALNLRDST